MVMHPTLTQSSPFQTLFLSQNSQQPKDHRHTRIQLNSHQTMADSIRNVFKMHRRTLDQHTNGNDSVKGLLGIGLRLKIAGGG